MAKKKLTPKEAKSLLARAGVDGGARAARTG